MSDILMYRKRKAKLQAKREAQAKKEARKLQVRQGIEGAVEPKEEAVNPIEKEAGRKAGQT